MKTLLLVLCCCAVTSAIGLSLGRKQSAGARGVLTCNGKPERNVLVKLYDDDRGIDADDFMGETKTDSDGHFEVSGHSSEFSTIDPKINIYHDCEDGLTPCQRKMSVMIPDKYVFSGENPKTFYEAGSIELSGKFKGEERDCIH
ncbi:Transthyretin-like protein 5 [Aphelenchoides bicaudatus]|nr:Transthyretin-like protein 5 [Aphelenchoides bicaudatus]